MKQREIRRRTGRLILWSTLAFALLLALGALTAGQLPAWRESRLENALSAGDTRTARRLAEHLEDAERREASLMACDYLDARTLMEKGRWEEAAALLAALGDYENAPELLSESRYQLALESMNSGENEAAAELFAQLGSYRDASQQAAECRYRAADALEREGDTAGAALLFAALGDYRDAEERGGALACRITGLADAQAALAQLRGLSAEDLALRQQLAEARAELKEGCLAAGFYHTLACRADGTALACGDNSFGQCRTESWTQITAVAAGAYHSLGLRSDGTVLAAGRNEEGQCEVSGWTQVVAVAAGDYASYGLRADGTILCAGLVRGDAARGWQGMTMIAAGSYELGALDGDGNACLAPGEIDCSELTGLAALAVNTGCAVGLRGDGTLVSAQLDVSDWTQMLSLSLSGTRLMGIDLDGRVRCLGFRPSDAVAVPDGEKAVALADGGTHVAVAFADGSVRVFGQSDCGQGDTGNWRLF